ncbi:hypothetical protein ACHAP8_009884 [Fusarium lateritium]
MTQKRKNDQKLNLNSGGYQGIRAQLDQMRFIEPLDAGTTKASNFYIRIKFQRFYRDSQLGTWRFVIWVQNCDKGLIMSFMHWICETYVKPRRERSKKKTLNQYWWDLKMLFRRANDGAVINANDCEEVVKYINGVDDLLLGLTHHWSRDTSVFPTEDDRLDLPTIMLFQAYSACRPAELVDSTKRRGRGDPLLEEADKLLQEDTDASDRQGSNPVFDEEDKYVSDATDDMEVDDDATTSVLEAKTRVFMREELPSAPKEQPANSVRKYKALCYKNLTLDIQCIQYST